MERENRKCEICGRKMPRAAYIPFNGGMIVCFSCFDEWEKLENAVSVPEFHEAVYDRQDRSN